MFGQKRIRFSQSSSILELRPHARYAGYWSNDGFYQSGYLHLDNAVIWKSGAELWTAVNFIHEGVQQMFPLAQNVVVPADDYDEAEVSVTMNTNRNAPLSFAMSVTRGGFFGGDRLAVSPAITWRQNDAFSTSLSWRYNDVSLPSSGFDIALTTFRMNYSLRPTFPCRRSYSTTIAMICLPPISGSPGYQTRTPGCLWSTTKPTMANDSRVRPDASFWLSTAGF